MLDLVIFLVEIFAWPVHSFPHLVMNAWPWRSKTNKEKRVKRAHISWHFPEHIFFGFSSATALANFPLSFGVGRNDRDNNEREKTATDSTIMTLINAHTQRTNVHLSRIHPVPSPPENATATRKCHPPLCTERKSSDQGS